MRLKLFPVFPILLVVYLVLPNTARADSFDWIWSGSDTGNGTLTATPVSGTDHELVTSMTGTFDGLTITGLLPLDTLLGNDNLIFPAQNGGPLGKTFLDFLGVSFHVTIGTPGMDWNFASNFGCQGPVCAGCDPSDSRPCVFYAANTLPQNLFSELPGTFTLTSVAAPEPGTLSLLLPGLITFGLLACAMRSASRFGVRAG